MLDLGIFHSWLRNIKGLAKVAHLSDNIDSVSGNGTTAMQSLAEVIPATSIMLASTKCGARLTQASFEYGKGSFYNPKFYLNTCSGVCAGAAAVSKTISIVPSSISGPCLAFSYLCSGASNRIDNVTSIWNWIF